MLTRFALIAFMELLLSHALRISSARYKSTTLEVMASRWRSFCRESLPYRDADNFLDKAGLSSTLGCFDSFTTRKRHFLLFRWVVRTLRNSGVQLLDPTPSLENEFSGEERPHHTVMPLDEHVCLLASEALSQVSGWKGLRLAAMVSLLGDTGLRSEAVRLLPLNAWNGESTLTIPGKGSAPSREATLSPGAVQALKAWACARPGTPGGLLFVADASGKALDPATVWRQLKRLEAKAGPLGAPTGGTTAIRAAYAQRLKERGDSAEDIQQALGHRRLSSTVELLSRIQSGKSRRRRSQGSEGTAGAAGSDKSTSS